MTDKQITALMLDNTAATRKYPFTRATLDQIKELRANEETRLKGETGIEYMVPAPVIIAQAIQELFSKTFNK